MAVSKKREKAMYKPPRRAGKENKNGPLFGPIMAAFYLSGVAWILVYYISRADYPLPVGNFNILIGFALMTCGFMMTTRWK